MTCITNIKDSDGNPTDILPDIEQPKKSTTPKVFIDAFTKLNEISENYDVNDVATKPPISAHNVEKHIGIKLSRSLKNIVDGSGKLFFVSYNIGEGAKGLRSELPLARIMTEMFFGNNAYGARHMPITLAADQAKTRWNLIFEKGHQKAFEKWLIATKANGATLPLNLDILRTEFGVTVNKQLRERQFLPEDNTVSKNQLAINKAINEGIRNYQEFDNRFSKYVEESGIIDFKETKKRDEWQPTRNYNRSKIFQLESKYGRDVLELLFGEAFRKSWVAQGKKALPDKMYKNVGTVIYRNLREGLSPKSKKRGLMRFDGINKYEAIDMDDPHFDNVAKEINKLTKQSTTGDISYFKDRVDLDDTVEISFTNVIDGQAQDVSLKFSDLLSEDLESNMIGMINRVVGKAEIANRFDLEGFGIKNNRDWAILMGALKNQAVIYQSKPEMQGKDIEGEFKKAEDTLDYLYRRTISEWVRNDVPEEVATNLKRFTLLTRLHMLGSSAAWQILESSKLVALWGLQQTIASSPDLFRHANDIRTGKISKNQAEAELIEATGLGEDTLIAHVTGLLDDMLISHTGELLNQAPIDRFLHRSNEVLTKYISPIIPLTDAYTRLNITMFVRSFSKTLDNIANMRSKGKSDEDIKEFVMNQFEKYSLTMNRMANFGMVSYQKVSGRKKLMPDFNRFMDIIKEMEKHVEKRDASWGGKVDKFNLDKWDARIRRDFTDLVTAHSWFSILRTEVGDVPKEFDTNIGGFFTAIMRFGFTAHSRNFLHNIHSMLNDRDSYPVKSVALEAAFAWALIETLNAVKSQAYDDSEAYREKLRAILPSEIINHMSNMGMTGSWYVTLGMMLGQKVGHADTYEDLIFSPPVLGEAANLFEGMDSIISMLSGNAPTESDIGDITNATLGNNVFGQVVKGMVNEVVADE